MAKVFLVDLEAVETRYTGEWKQHVPTLLEEHGHEVYVISGPHNIPSATTPGAFLNFGGTNIYKAAQVEEMGHLFTEGRVNKGDHFLFTDAWHPGIINLKYMSELLGIPVTIHALWHAGSYDPQDFLGRLIGDAPWVRHSEKAFFHAIDHNYFATDFHIKLFSKVMLGYTLFKNVYDNNHFRTNFLDTKKIVRSGWPMEYMPETLAPFRGRAKRDLILFPHRIAPEKQLEIFKDLASRLPQYEWVVCQEQQLTKEQYHNMLAEAKIVFSANLQETLGISMYEGALVDAVPLVPSRLSYMEMYDYQFQYPGEWTESWPNYQQHTDKMVDKIVDIMESYDSLKPAIEAQAHRLTENFFSAKTLLENLR